MYFSNVHSSNFIIRFGLALLLLPISISVSAVEMKTTVDATDITRGLIKTSTEFQVRSGIYELYYPEWIPGIHGPRNPVQNLAEVTVQTTKGESVKWRRDPHDAFKFQVEVPKGARRIVVCTTYICNQPSVNSRSVDSYGNSLLGVINWNTCLLYPAGVKASDVKVDLSLIIPEGWKWGSSLIQKNDDENSVQFETISFEDLVDSPLICGKYLKTFDLTPKDGPQHSLHLVSESDKAVRPKDETIDGLKRIVEEAALMLRKHHFEHYHFLLVLSDTVPGMGLEHLRSSLNGEGERGLLDENQIIGAANLLSHEYCHSWCGKYRRPAGMVLPDFNTPMDTRLLWVYEGLDQYLGKVLAARAEINAKKDKPSFDETLKRLGGTIKYYMSQKGRRSISLEDTSSSSYIRRGGSRYWSRLNRGQDYYSEGAMLWMNIDAILRIESEGELCLDDFCREFLGYEEKGKTITGFEESDIVEILNKLQPYDWAELIDSAVRGLHTELPLDFIGRCGYRVQYSNEATDFDKDCILTSLGLGVSGDGRIYRIVPGGAADQSGLYETAKIIGVNDRKFSKKRLEDAIADSVAMRSIKLLMLKGDLFETVTVNYADGPKYLDLVRNDEPDLLKKIWKPLASE